MGYVSDLYIDKYILKKIQLYNVNTFVRIMYLYGQVLDSKLESSHQKQETTGLLQGRIF